MKKTAALAILLFLPLVSLTLFTKTVYGATFVVCASNAERKGAGCDYVCDGTNDEVEIQAAINALPNSKGTILLTEGTFNIGASIVINGHITIQGMGILATNLKLANNANDDMFKYTGTEDTAIFITMRDFYAHGNKANNTTGSFLDTANHALGCPWDGRNREYMG